MTQEAFYHIALTLIDGIGHVAAKKLIQHCGSAEALFRLKKAELIAIDGMRDSLIASISKPKAAFERAERELVFAENNKIQVLLYSDDKYPRRLRHCSDSPIVLFYKGQSNLNEEKMIGIVGTRSMTDYGKVITQKLVKGLASLQVSIVSGMAYGVDICAHREALQQGLPTIGVMAHGLDRVYPFVHIPTAERMYEQGGLLTEFLSETIPDKENFPKRNRIVAGMCDAIVVVEAGPKGGALITAELAHSYNRDVFAVPGNVGANFSSGCNKLIKINKAALVESAEDIAYSLNWGIKKEKITVQKSLFVELNREEEIIVKVLETKGQLPIDELTYLADFPLSKVAGLLLNLEFNGLVKSLPGKVYALN